MMNPNNRMRRIISMHMTLASAFTWLLKLFALFGIVSFGIVVYALYYENPFFEYQNLPFPVVGGKVEQGDTVPIVIERCSNSGSQRVYVSSRTLKNVDTNKEIDLPESTVSLKSGCSRVTSRSIVIPPDTPPGTYVIEGEAVTEGLLKQHHVEWYTERFQVVKSTPLAQKLREEAALMHKAERQGF